MVHDTIQHHSPRRWLAKVLINSYITHEILSSCHILALWSWIVPALYYCITDDDAYVSNNLRRLFPLNTWYLTIKFLHGIRPSTDESVLTSIASIEVINVQLVFDLKTFSFVCQKYFLFCSEYFKKF